MTNFVITSFIIWRTVLFFIGWLGSIFVAFHPRFPYSDIFLLPSGLPKWLWSFSNFDGVHYLTIAKTGYSAQFTQVFFPGYSLLLSTLSKLLPFINSIILGLFLSNLFFLLSLIILAKLLLLDYKLRQVKWIILFILLFPTSFFFGSIYSESLFIFLVVYSYYLARKKHWWLAGLLGAAASATRLAGIFLLPSLLWEWEGRKKFQSPILYLVPLGLISYMIYLQITFGDALYFWHVQPVFGAQRSGSGLVFLPQVFWRYIKILGTVSVKSEGFWIAFSEISFTLFAIISLIIAHIKKIRFSYLLFSWLAVLIPTFTGTLSSMPRYILVAFPIYIVFALIKSNLKKSMILFFSFMLLIIYTIIFTGGRWVA